jgi:hypothetical protein
MLVCWLCILMIIRCRVFRFKKLDLDNSGSLSVDEFMSLPELQQNPLVQRVIGRTKTLSYSGSWAGQNLSYSGS